MLITLPDLLTAEQCKTIVTAIEPLEWSAGKSDDKTYKSEVKHNQELSDHPDTKTHITTVYQAIISNLELAAKTFPQQVMAPRFNRYDKGQTYKRHVDGAFMGNPSVRTDLSLTLFLNDSYEGGELVLEYPTGEGRKVKEPTGTLVCYSTDIPHYVAPVTKGTRFASITWIKSFVQDPHKRSILATVQQCTLRERANGMTSRQYAELMGVHQNLLRMWSG